MLDDDRTHRLERSRLGIPPLPLTAEAVTEVTARLGGPGPSGELLEGLAERVPPGVNDAARVKASYLNDVARGAARSALLGPADAVALLGTMQGGYNVGPLVELLDDPDLADLAATMLGRTVLVFDAFDPIVARAENAGPAERVVRAWAEAAWFLDRPAVPAEIHVRVLKVEGEITTDDLSPATQAWCRADIPLHALSLLGQRVGPEAVAELIEMRASGEAVAFVGDVVGTGSSRKSAVNSLVWHIGEDIADVPNRRRGGVVLGRSIAPIFFDSLRDAGTLAIECDVSAIASGDRIVVRPHDGVVSSTDGTVLARFEVPTRLIDQVRAGGRAQLIIGRQLTARAREVLGLGPTDVFAPTAEPVFQPGYTLAQKIVGRACGRDGVGPGTSCEPVASTVGSQDTTGPLNRAELEDIACLGFSADLVLQTFCHTAAYPKAVDIATQRTLPRFMGSRGAVVLRPGDGIIHSWLNRMLLPDQVGTGSDSHTRFPLGISFPAGSGQVAFAAALGVLPLDLPESVLVRFRGDRQPGVTLRDLVHAIPYSALEQGLLTLDKATKRNVFAGRIIEIEGMEDLSVDEAFELTDATAERSAAAATIALSEESVARHLRSCVSLLRQLIDDGYEGAPVLARRAEAMERWLARPTLLRADPDATYAAVLEIDLASISEPLLACPNDPDDVKPLSAVAGTPVDEVFVGSCMTRLEHFRAAGAVLARATEAGDGPTPVRLWIAPPTRMDEAALRAEGHYATFGAAGARTEVPGCSLCMGNQARVADGATVVSTSTRNFPNRMGRDARVFLASAEVAAMAGVLGRIPTVAEYRDRLERSRPGHTLGVA